MGGIVRKFCTPAEAGEILSLKLKTVYSLIQRGEIPAIKLGHQVRVDLRRLDEAIEAKLKKGGWR